MPNTATSTFFSRPPPAASAGALARAKAKQASLDASAAIARKHTGNGQGNRFVGVGRAGDGGPVYVALLSILYTYIMLKLNVCDCDRVRYGRHSGIYDPEDDPDRLYFERGLGRLDSDEDSGDEESVGLGDLDDDWGDEDVSPLV